VVGRRPGSPRSRALRARAGAAALVVFAALGAAGSARSADFTPSPQLTELLDAKAPDGSAWVSPEAREYFDGLPSRAKEWLDAAVEKDFVSEPEHLSEILSLRLQAGQLELLLHDNCALCHSDPATQDPETLFSIDPAAKGSPAHLDLREFVSDVHFRSGLSCAGCHGGKPSDEEMPDEIYDRWPEASVRHADRSWIPGFCARCHADPEFMRGFDPGLATDQYAKYQQSQHGIRLLGQHDSKAAQCVSCHGVHGIRGARSPNSKVHPKRLPYTCGECHANAATMAGYRTSTGHALPVNQLADYEKSVHGRALLERGDLGAPACNDCHGNHAALPPETSSIAQVCRTCHNNEGEQFDGSKHKEAFDRQGWPECSQCHGSHAIAEAEDSMLDEKASPLCYDCHREHALENPQCLETARHFHDSIAMLAVSTQELTARVSDLAERGLDPDPLSSTVEDLHETLRQARSRIHTFDRGEFDLVVLRGREAQAEGQKLLKDAEAEYRFRTRGLGLAVGVMAVLGILLYLKIREIDRRGS
jgi:predicted CXXCH cytochrome family protein